MAAKSPMDAYMSRKPLPLAPPEKPPIPKEALSLTLADLLKRGDLPPEVRAWVERAAGDRDWARANNPPGFVSDEGCWDRPSARPATREPTTSTPSPRGGTGRIALNA